MAAILRLAADAYAHNEPVSWAPGAVLRLLTDLQGDLETAIAVALRRRTVHWWWLMDQAANRAVGWTGRRCATAFDRLVDAEQQP